MVTVQELHAGLAEVREKDIVEQRVLLLNDTEHAVPDRIEDLLRRQLLGPLCGCADLDTLLQRSDANLEELIEIRAGDAQKTQPLEQRHGRVQGHRQHALVELELAEFPIDVQVGRCE